MNLTVINLILLGFTWESILELTHEFGTLIGAGICGLVIGIAQPLMSRGLTWLKSKFRKKDDMDSDLNGHFIGISPDSDMPERWQQIFSYVVELRKDLDADRVQIGMFHNGGEFLDNLPIKRFSVTHESCKKGVSFEKSVRQGQILTSFWDLVIHLKKDDARIIDVSNMDESYFKTLLESVNINYISAVPLKRNGIILGFMLIEWTTRPEIINDSEKLMKLIDDSRDYVQLECRWVNNK